MSLNLSKYLSTIGCVAAAACSAMSQAQTSPPAWSATASYVFGDVVNIGGNEYRCTVANVGQHPTSVYADWELANVRKSLNLNVGAGQTFPDLVTSWNYVASATISPACVVHIKIITTGGAFSENFTTAFNLDHPFGSAIDITGDHVNNVQLNFKNTYGFTIDSGHSIKGLNNLTINGNRDEIGLLAVSNSSVSQVAGCLFNGWSVDVDAQTNATITAAGIVVWSGIGDRDVEADSGGVVNLPANSKLSLSGGLGLFARDGGKIFVGSGSKITGGYIGAWALDGGQIKVNGCTFSGNTIDLQAYDDSSIVAGDSATYASTNIDSTSHLFTVAF